MTAAVSSASDGDTPDYPTRGSAAPASREVAIEVARRLADPVLVGRCLTGAAGKGEGTTWTIEAFARGNAGLAFALSTIARTVGDAALESAAERYLAGALRAIRGAVNPPPGLYTGLAGMLVACAAAGVTSGKAIDDLAAALDRSVGQLADSSRRDGMPVVIFDAISGLAGIIAAATLLPHSEHVADLTRAAVAALVDLVLDDADPPRWHTPGALLPGEWMRQGYPDGNLNLGLAHGMAGAVAALSIGWLSGACVPGHLEAIERGALRLRTAASSDPWGITWPVAVPLGTTPPVFTHAGWCYGSSGIAGALRLAGQATGSPTLAAAAAEAMDATLRRPTGARQLHSPGVCHGTAGLLEIAGVFADDGHAGARQAIGQLREDVLSAFDPRSALGFRVLETGGWVDQPGLLDGVAGIPLALLGADGVAPASWRRVLLLA